MEDSYLDNYWESQNEIPDSHDEWDEWEKDRLVEDFAADREEEEREAFAASEGDDALEEQFDREEVEEDEQSDWQDERDDWRDEF